MYFFPEDYLKFIYNLEYYLSIDLEFISIDKSKHSTKLKEQKQSNVPIGKLEDIEIIFLHYKSNDEALEKWNKRKARVNLDNIIIKFSEMNGCTIEHLKVFENLNGVKKFMYVTKEEYCKEFKSAILYNDLENGLLLNDTFYWDKFIDIRKLINEPITQYYNTKKIDALYKEV